MGLQPCWELWCRLSGSFLPTLWLPPPDNSKNCTTIRWDNLILLGFPSNIHVWYEFWLVQHPRWPVAFSKLPAPLAVWVEHFAPQRVQRCRGRLWDWKWHPPPPAPRRHGSPSFQHLHLAGATCKNTFGEKQRILEDLWGFANSCCTVNICKYRVYILLPALGPARVWLCKIQAAYLLATVIRVSRQPPHLEETLRCKEKGQKKRQMKTFQKEEEEKRKRRGREREAKEVTGEKNWKATRSFTSLAGQHVSNWRSMTLHFGKKGEVGTHTTGWCFQ